MDFREEVKTISDPEEMAEAFLTRCFGEGPIEYPIDPFYLLKKEGVMFSLINAKKLEGVYIPAEDDDDIPVVGINVNRIITRQRFTAAHELCHHFRDYDKPVQCPIGSKTPEEKFANRFAAAFLMPLPELTRQVEQRKDSYGIVDFDSILEISEFFGVSFETCMFRIAYELNAIDGDTDSAILKKKAKKYKPDAVRKARHMSHAKLYADLIDNLEEQLRLIPTEHAKNLFQNNYIYNDSRMEGLDISPEEAAEIVTDIRMNTQNSEYCSEDNEAYLSIAGHYDMYEEIFELPSKERFDVYELFRLNSLLFGYYPNSEYGGGTRQTNTLVLGAKFDTVDYKDIHEELIKVNKEVQKHSGIQPDFSLSDYIKHIARIHHRLTVIHPFADGNGRTTRAFMNAQLVRAGLKPLYIKAEDKEEYKVALAFADQTGNYDDLYEIIFQSILRALADLQKG